MSGAHTLQSSGRTSGAAAPAAAGAPPIVSFRGVSKSYDGLTRVVHSLDLDIARGEFLTLLGPSGSGKTTSLMMLAGFEAPSEGEITLNGRSLASVPPYRRNIGMVFQSYALFPHLTVAGNLAYPLRMRRMPKSEVAPRIARALGMVQLGPFADRKPQSLSGGQQQRVALARALVFEPDLILMDEPLGALDKQLREHMQIEIKHIQQQLGVTVIYVTHDQSEALTMSDRVAVFNAGRVEQIDAPSRLYEAPQTEFVAGFVGESNTIRGVLHEVRAGLGLVDTEGGRLRAILVGDPRPGAAVSLAVRPERVRLIGPGTADPSADNQADATLVEIIYAGDHGRARLRAFGADDFVLKLPVERLGAMPAPGCTLRIGWQAEHCRAFPTNP